MFILELAQILDAIDRNKSFEAAAYELCKVRSALTYTIRKYEDYFGFKIFDRSKHRAKFTPAGQLLLEQGRQLILMNQQAIDLAKEVALGWERELRVACDEILNINPLFELLKEFQTHCPQVDLYISNERLNGCLDALLNKRADIAIGLSGQLPTSNEFAFIEIGRIEFLFVMSPLHPLAHYPEPINTELIYQFPAIVASDSAYKIPARTTGLLSTQRRFTFSNMRLKIDAQVQGLGVGFLPAHLIINELERGTLVKKEVIQQKPSGIYYLVWSKGKTGKAHAWLISRLREKLFYQALFK